MTTIVIHGTLSWKPAKYSPWWWDSMHAGGFLHAVAEGMESVGVTHDVWRVQGRPVSQVEELQQKWSLWTGSWGQLVTHKGHFFWTGANAGFARDGAATTLADYLNKLNELTDEPLRVIAYSHGCNVLKHATTCGRLNPDVFIDRAVFLAGPHFFARTNGETKLLYHVDPHRFGRILNLYSRLDSVQSDIAEAVRGQQSARLADFMGYESDRIDHDPDPSVKALYDNYEIDIEPAAAGIQAHNVMHGATVGRIVGMWLGGTGRISDVVAANGGALPVVPADDEGN